MLSAQACNSIDIPEGRKASPHETKPEARNYCADHPRSCQLEHSNSPPNGAFLQHKDLQIISTPGPKTIFGLMIFAFFLFELAFV